MTQSTIGEFDSEPETDDASIPELQKPKKYREYAEPNNPRSCPWCFAPPEEFRENPIGETACSRCSSVIPIETEWYQNGDKIADDTLL